MLSLSGAFSATDDVLGSAPPTAPVRFFSQLHAFPLPDGPMGLSRVSARIAPDPMA